MSSLPAVTVVTATYNWPDALRVAIKSVLEQTFTDFEYLIIGDACTDETADVVAEFNDPRIRWVNLIENLGNQSDVNRIALTMARGEVIAYLNHDDIWFPEHLAELYAALETNEFDIVNSLALSLTPPGQVYRAIIGSPWKTNDPGGYSVYPMTSNVMHTLDAARAVGSWAPWRTLDDVPTQEFFRRLRNYRARFGVVPLVTSLKFHSGDRRNSYLKKTADEQEHWYKQMLTDPGLRHREMAVAYCCKTLPENPQSLKHPKRPENAPPGWQVEQWRRLRGLDAMIDLGESEPEESDQDLPPPKDTMFRRSTAGQRFVASKPGGDEKAPGANE